MQKLVALAAVLAARLAFAAVPTVQITGSVMDPSGIGVVSGQIVCALSQPGSVLDGAVSVRVAARTTLALTAGGALAASAVLVPNDAITPSGTAYTCRYLVSLTDGTSTTWVETWQLASTPSPINIGAVPRAATLGTVFATGPTGPQGPQGPTGPSGAGPAFGNPGATLYVKSDTGNNTNDCLTWNSACQTILGAYDKLSANGGTIYFGDNSCVGGEVADQGIWIIGPDDPLYATPPAGWRQGKARVSFVGVTDGALRVQFGRPGAATMKAGACTSWARNSLKPAIWISGWSEPMSFKNITIYLPQVGVRLGVGTDNTNRNRMTALIDFENVNIQSLNDGGVDQGAGPVVDVGYAYWITWRKSALMAYAAAPLGNDRRAVFLLKTGAAQRSPGLWTVEDNRLGGGGGLKYYVAGTASSWGQVVMRDCLLESDFVNPADPIFWIVDYAGGGSANEVTNVSVADAPGTTAFVKTYGRLPANLLVATNAGPVDGPAILQGTSTSLSTKTPGVSRQVVFGDGTIDASIDAARAGGAPGTTRTTPKALGSWPPSSGGTITVSNVAGPTGVGAYRLASSATVGTRDQYTISFLDSGTVSAVGDLWVYGAWVRAPSGLYTDGPSLLLSFNQAQATIDQSDFTFAYNLPPSHGAWTWMAYATKVTTTTGGAGDVMLATWLYNGYPIEVFAPVAYKFAAGTYVENDVREWARHMIPVSPAVTPGNVALLPGQSLEFGLTSGTNGGRQISYGATAPGSGTWNAGSHVLNSAPAVGGTPFAWAATVAGTPGTWTPLVAASSVGTITLSSGTPSTGTATVASGSRCVCTNQTAQANPIKCAVAATILTATGPNTVTDVVTYACF